MKELELEHLNGPLKGHKSRFRAGQVRVTLGRSASCDIRYPASASQIGREHLELIREAEHYELQINTRDMDMVSVNGRLASDGQELAEKDLVELGGAGGPRFVVHYKEPVDTKDAPPARPAASRSPRDASLWRRRRHIRHVLLAVVVLLAAWFIWLYWRAES